MEWMTTSFEGIYGSAITWGVESLIQARENHAVVYLPPLRYLPSLRLLQRLGS